MLKPLLFLASIGFISLSSNSQNWQQLGTSFSEGYAAYADMIVHQGTPYVVYMDEQDGYQTNVQKFNGTSWEYVGSQDFTDSTFNHCIAVSNDTLFVAFKDKLNGFGATVMKFNGTDWVNVGAQGFSPGSAGQPRLFVDNLTPYVVFRDGANGNKTSVMKFNGTNWEFVGSPGISQSSFTDFNDIWVENGEPYVVSSTSASGATVHKFNGTSWELVGQQNITSIGSAFHKFYFDQGTPYLILKDYDNGDKGAVYKFDGTQWAMLGSHFSSGGANSEDLFVLDGIPFVVFMDLTQSFRSTVKFYNGTSWVDLGNTNISVGQAEYNAIAIDNGIAYVCFTDAGDGAKTSVYTFDIGLGLVQNALQEITIFPNPTSGMTTIQFENNHFETIKLLTLSGEVLEIFKKKNEEIDLSTYPAGTYILRIESQSNTYFRRLVKQ